MNTTAIETLVIPFVAAGRITSKEGDEVCKRLKLTLTGTPTSETTVSYLVMLIESEIRKVKNES